MQTCMLARQFGTYAEKRDSYSTEVEHVKRDQILQAKLIWAGRIWELPKIGDPNRVP